MSVFVAPLDADVHRDFEIQYGTTNITQLRNILRCNLLKVSAENNLHAALACNGEVVVFEIETINSLTRLKFFNAHYYIHFLENLQ